MDVNYNQNIQIRIRQDKREPTSDERVFSHFALSYSVTGCDFTGANGEYVFMNINNNTNGTRFKKVTANEDYPYIYMIEFWEFLEPSAVAGEKRSLQTVYFISVANMQMVSKRKKKGYAMLGNEYFKVVQLYEGPNKRPTNPPSDWFSKATSLLTSVTACTQGDEQAHPEYGRPRRSRTHSYEDEAVSPLSMPTYSEHTMPSQDEFDKVSVILSTLSCSLSLSLLLLYLCLSISPSLPLPHFPIFLYLFLHSLSYEPNQSNPPPPYPITTKGRPLRRHVQRV